MVLKRNFTDWEPLGLYDAILSCIRCGDPPEWDATYATCLCPLFSKGHSSSIGDIRTCARAMLTFRYFYLKVCVLKDNLSEI